MSSSSSITRIRPFIPDSYQLGCVSLPRPGDAWSVARVLICEPDPDVQSLIAFVAQRLGHEPVVSDGTLEQAETANVIVLEPGNADLLALVRQLSDVPIVCVSIYPPDDEVAPL